MCVFSPSGPIFAQGFGTTSVEGPATPVAPSTVFRIGSVSKPLFGTVVCALADRGSVDLDAPVDEYLPGFSVPGRQDSGGITLRHLLSHRSGLPTGSRSTDGASRNLDALEDFALREAPKFEPLAPPGTLYCYSEVGIPLAGHAIERAVGQPFPTLMRELLFEPLGMKRTTYDPTEAMTYPLSQHHVPGENGRPVVDHKGREATRLYPAGMCFSTVLDLALFGGLHLAEGCTSGGARLLSAEKIAEMRRPEADIMLDVNLRYGLTFTAGPGYGGHDRIGHEGFFRGTWAKLILSPAHDVGLAWCDNRGPDPSIDDARYEVMEQIFIDCGAGPASWKRDAEPDGVRRDAGNLNLYSGDYVQADDERQRVAVKAAGDRLRLVSGGRELALSRVSEAIFSSEERPSWEADAPWSRHAGSRRVSAGFISSQPGDEPRFLLLNGLPFKRLPVVPNS